MIAVFLDEYGAQIGTNEASVWADDQALTSFAEFALEDIAAPEGTVAVLISLTVKSFEPGGHDFWITKVMFDDGGGSCAGYADGDVVGWEWLGDAHNSYSREAETYGANVLINGGASVVFERDVTLALNPGSVDATEMAVRNDEDGYGAWEAFAATKAWTLSAACKVWAKFRDGA